MEYGLQLYSVRDLAKESFEEALKQVAENEWQVVIPQSLVKTHEYRFSSVMKVYLGYLAQGEIPAWERSHMISKYYTTTKAYELAK